MGDLSDSFRRQMDQKVDSARDDMNNQFNSKLRDQN